MNIASIIIGLTLKHCRCVCVWIVWIVDRMLTLVLRPSPKATKAGGRPGNVGNVCVNILLSRSLLGFFASLLQGHAGRAEPLLGVRGSLGETHTVPAMREGGNKTEKNVNKCYLTHRTPTS